MSEARNGADVYLARIAGALERIAEAVEASPPGDELAAERTEARVLRRHLQAALEELSRCGAQKREAPLYGCLACQRTGSAGGRVCAECNGFGVRP